MFIRFLSGRLRLWDWLFRGLAAQQLLLQVQPFRFCNFKQRVTAMLSFVVIFFLLCRADPLSCIPCQNLNLFPKFRLLWFTCRGTLRTTLSHCWKLTVRYMSGICYSLCQGFSFYSGLGILFVSETDLASTFCKLQV